MNKQELLKTAKPILFNTEMVKAILEGRKNKTRRVFDYQKWQDKNLIGLGNEYPDIKDGKLFITYPTQGMPDGSGGIETDYETMDITDTVSKYKVNDVLYIRETFYTTERTGHIFYKADDNEAWEKQGMNFKWKPSIHMPKEYARIFLTVTDVRVERLQDISIDDMKAEGLTHDTLLLQNGVTIETQLKRKWINLWNSTAPKQANAKFPEKGFRWEDNPYVFCYEFERIEG